MSLVDQFFTRKEVGKFSCNICGVVLAGSVGKVSNLNKHLRMIHKDYKDAADAKKRQDTASQQSSITPSGQLSQFIPFKKDSDQHKRLTNLVIQAVADGYLSLAVVDRDSFRALVQGLNPRYDMPGRKGLTAGILKEAKACKERRLDCLQGATTVTVTLDLWSNRRMRSFLGETAHFISTNKDGHLSMSSCMLACRRFEDRHTAANIAWHHQAVVSEHGIGQKVVVAVTDSAANMKKAFCLMEADHGETDGDSEEESDDVDSDDEMSPVSVTEIMNSDRDSSQRPVAASRVACACHTLQLAVRDGLKEMPNSVARAVARIMDRRKQFLHVANATRWNSQLRSIKSYLALTTEILDELQEAVPALASKVVDEAGRRALLELVEILTPLAEATDALQGEKEPTGSSVIPTVRILRMRLGTLTELHGQLSRVARALLDSVNARFEQYASNSSFKTATFLDPRWKLGVMAKTAGERAQIQTEVEEELVTFLERFPPPAEEDLPVASSGRIAASDAPQVTQPSTSGESSSHPQSSQEPPSKRGFFDLLDEDEDEPPPVRLLTLRQRVAAEMDAYAREPREDREAPGRALAYWSGQRAAKPVLSHCAAHFLAIPASSAPSERLFSVAGRFFSPSRSRLSPELFESLMAIKAECM